ncbi:MAG: protein arginine kinase [Verrucomicrobia bacterium GWC2_42_7]|nr:MAG: protein arginine kinase [Verrucomicrobia bacterium GWC2_42_7]
MKLLPFIESSAQRGRSVENSGPVVLSTRIRLARNLASYPFPHRANVSQRRDILSRCFKAVKEMMPETEGGVALEISELSVLEKQFLVERHLISRELSNAEAGAGVYINGDLSCSIMINEEDHLRIQMIKKGFNFKPVWKAINDLDTALERHLDYAFSHEYGYLTACPTNLGTGMRASVMMHLPGLVIAAHMEKVIKAVSHLGIAVRGIFGEGSDANGSVFQISNQLSLGDSEAEIFKKLTAILNVIIAHELGSRQILLESKKSRLYDKLGRAYGILKNGYFVSSEEAMNLLSLIRLAIDLEFLPEKSREQIDRLFMEVQPAHLQIVAGNNFDADERDSFRSDLLRKEFAKFSRLNLK